MKRRNGWFFIKGILFIQLFLLAVIAGLTVDLNAGIIKAWGKAQPSNMLLPFSALQIDERQAEQFLQENNLLMTGGVRLIKQLGLTKLSSSNLAENMIDSQIQVLAYTDSEEDTGEDISQPEQVNPVIHESDQGVIKMPEAVDPEIFKGHGIYIYCTHSAETYIPDSGQARVDGKRGLINSVASRMEQDLQAKGLSAQFINTIHDFPDYNSSYTNSRTTVKRIIQSNNDVLALLDVHRDSIPGTSEASTIDIQGRKSARILIVVGTDERKPHPNWKKNYQFAQALFTQSEKMYPGLIKGVRAKAGTYNQEFHPRALLLEFGSDYNTVEEASYAAHLFTEVLVQVLKEDFQQQ